jgi:hypothetical protein
MGRIALGALCPVLGIKAEEQRDVAHGVCLGTVHIPEEEIPKFNGIQSRQQETPLFGSVNRFRNGTRSLTLE